MLDITEKCKNAYYMDCIEKDVFVEFPEIGKIYSHDDINTESLELKEAILNGNSLEFVGCISNYFKIDIYNVDTDVKGQKMTAYVKDLESNEKVYLFTGIVDSAQKDGYSGFKTIKAYDVLYTLSNEDITDWYNDHGKTTLYRLLGELLDKYNIPLKYSYLVNGNFTAYCGTRKKVSQLSALDLLKQICQINAGFGKINRNGEFQLLYIGEKTVPALFPSKNLFPRKDLYPSKVPYSKKTNLPAAKIEAYRKLTYEEYAVEPITKVVIRNNADVKGATYGDGDNKYIVQANLFVFNQKAADIQTMARNIYLKVKGISYKPFRSENNGLPWLECGDTVAYDDVDINVSEEYETKFWVFSRTLKGIQAMKDVYEAKGQQFQNEFITDLKAELESLKEKNNSDYDVIDTDLAELRARVDRLEAMAGSGSYAIGNIFREKVLREVRAGGNGYIGNDIVVGVITEDG